MTEDLWRWGNYIGLSFLIIPIAVHFHKRIGWVFVFAWVYFLFRSLSIFENPISFYPKIATQLDQTTGQAFAQLLVIPLAVLCLPPRVFKYWPGFFTGLGLFDLCLLATRGHGLMVGNSFDTALMALLVLSSPVWAGVLFTIGIVAVQGATAFFMLAAGVGVFCFMHYKKRKYATALAATAVIVVAGYLLQGDELVNSSGRLGAYQHFFSWWTSEGAWTWVIGTGIGTFQWLGPFIGPFHDRLYLQLHSDWLQVLFEGGLVGLCLAGLCYLQLLVAALTRPKILSLLAAFGIFALTYHPLRFFPSALFLACLIRETMETK